MVTWKTCRYNKGNDDQIYGAYVFNKLYPIELYKAKRKIKGRIQK